MAEVPQSNDLIDIVRQLAADVADLKNRVGSGGGGGGGGLVPHQATHQANQSDELQHNTLGGLTTGNPHTQYALAASQWTEAMTDAEIVDFLRAGTNITLTLGGDGRLYINASGAGGGGLDAEAVRDVVQAMFVDGTTVNFTTSDVGDSVTAEVSALGPGNIAGLNEHIMDTIGGTLVPGSGITIGYDDTLDQITISSAATVVGNGPFTRRLQSQALATSSLLQLDAPADPLTDYTHAVVMRGNNQTEIQRVTSRSASQVGLANPLANTHPPGTLIMFIDNPEALAVWWGVMGNSANHGAALNSALAALDRAGTFVNKMLLPPGIILTSVPIDIPFNKWLIGAGPSTAGTSIKAVAPFTFPDLNTAIIRTKVSAAIGGVPVKYNVASGTPGYGMTQTYLIDLHIDGANIAGSNGILSAQQQPAYWKNINIRDCAGTGLILCNGQDLDIDGLQMYHCGNGIQNFGHQFVRIRRLNIEAGISREVIQQRNAVPGEGYEPYGCTYDNVHIEAQLGTSPIGFDIRAGKNTRISNVECNVRSVGYTIINMDMPTFDEYGGVIYVLENVWALGTVGAATLLLNDVQRGDVRRADLYFRHLGLVVGQPLQVCTPTTRNWAIELRGRAAQGRIARFGVPHEVGSGGSKAAMVHLDNGSGNGDIALFLDAGVPQLAIDQDGFIQVSSVTKFQTGVGATGTASAPPPLPKKWLRIKDETGATVLIPCYNS